MGKSLEEMDQIIEYEVLKATVLKYDLLKGDAREWWNKFEEVNIEKIETLLELSKELAKRESSIADFFLAYIHSKSKSVTEILDFLDYIKEKLEPKETGSEPKSENDGKEFIEKLDLLLEYKVTALDFYWAKIFSKSNSFSCIVDYLHRFISKYEDTPSNIKNNIV